MASTQIDILDGLSSATAYKGPCKVATVSNITLAGEQTIDGVSIVTGDRVLVRGQTLSQDNGIYVADTGIWRRAKDFVGIKDVRKGTRVWVTEGDSGPAEFEVMTENPVIIGTTSVTFNLSSGSVNSAALAQAVINAQAKVDEAEAFADIAAGHASDAVSQGNVPVYSTAVGVTALSIPNGITAFRTNGYSVVGDRGEALYVKASGTPSSTLGTGRLRTADGAWWTYVVVGSLRLEQFGGKADWNGTTGTDNWQPFQDALAQVSVGAVASVRGGPEIWFFSGTYHFTQAIELKTIVTLRGLSAGGHPSGIGFAILHFPIDCHGIVVNRSDTLNGGVITATTAADGSSIEDLRITSAGGTDTTKAGIWCRARASLRNLIVDRFPGNGVQIIGTGNGAGTARGNANECYVENISCESNGGHGFMTQGSDANAGTFIKVGVRGNKKCGIYENSFLGNTYIGAHFDTGSVNVTAKGRVSYNGRLYQLLQEGTIGGLTTPGTNNAVWYDNGVDAGAPTGAPAWASGGSYEVDCPIWGGSNNTQSVFIGTYVETGWGVCHLTKPGIAIQGGSWSTLTLVQAGSLSDWRFLGGSVAQNAATITALATFGANVNSRLGGNADLGQILNFDNTLAGQAWRQRFIDAYSVGVNVNNVATYLYLMYATGSRFKGGRSVEIANAFQVSNLMIGAGSTSRRVGYLSAAPTTGTFAKGEIIFNSAAAVGAPTAWSCTTGGSITQTAWVGSTAYALDTIRLNGTNVYVCTTAGTSASSGGPTGTGTGIADGTAVWDYASPFVFTAWANL